MLQWDICEPSDIVKALFDFQEYENNLLTTSSPTIVPDCTNDKNIIMTQDDVIMFTYASFQKEKNTISAHWYMDIYG